MYWKKYESSPSRKLRLEKKHYDAVFKTLNCRTSRLGYTAYQCKQCLFTTHIYRSCKNRFCPTCGILETYKWADSSLSRLLDMKHHHIVFTLPKPLRHIRKLNGDLLFNILFEESSRVIKEWFNKKHGIKPGIVSILHTAGSDLKDHPHVHMIVTRGGLNLEIKEVIKIKGSYLTRQRFLANLFSKHFTRSLMKQFKSGNLKVPRKWNGEQDKFAKWLKDLSDKQWIASIQEPLENLERIVGYVGRYTKRACISEYKLKSTSNDKISFLYNDYKNTKRGEKPKQSLITLKSEEFLDKLLSHVPTKRFRMVRYFGIYSSSYQKNLPQKEQKTNNNKQKVELDHSWGEFEELRKEDIQRGKPDPLTCPHCQIKLDNIGVYYVGQKILDDP